MNHTTNHKSWFPFGFGSVLASHRLFCLPFAGGGASFFLPWRKALANLAVVPVQYPGRETRMAEACRTDLAQLVEELVQAILPQLDRPYYLLGYSLGAKVGFAMCHRLAALGAPAPDLFLALAHGAPDVPPGLPGAYRLPDAEFFEYVQRYGGLPDIVLGDPELMRMLVPILRADIGLVEHAVPNQALTCPILAYAGKQDHAADSVAVGGWRRFAQNGFALRSFDGGHFFARTASDFLPTLAGDLKCV
ncbi:thioesterase II family protein [Propionivibrio sp.]|jgi:surfactin synthase thioesterase subunit|uniref:thioesterase II family protein n=1 Tax=Propionivibrio sp. TaxID=2212460 RepID=UPI003BF169AC